MLISSIFLKRFFLDNLVIEYRDPILGVILVVAVVFFISFFTYSYGIYKEKKARKDYRKISLRFELGNLKENDYVNLYKTYNLPFDTILLLASSSLHKGDYNKAISIYLSLLEHVKDRVKKEELLELLGNTYFKGGFLQRSKDVFLKILKFSPRNKNVLRNLMLVNDKLKDYKKSLEICEALNELNVDIALDLEYYKGQIILNDSLLSIEKRASLLKEIYQNSQNLERVYISFLLQFDKKEFWKNIDSFNLKNIIDILWFQRKEDLDFEAIKNNIFLSELYSAKNYYDLASSSSDFNLDILILLNKNGKYSQASLNFEFICKSCKHSHPFSENRCPNCNNLLSMEVKHHLCKAFFETNQSLQ